MFWIVLMLAGVAVLIHMSTKGKSAKEQLAELRSENEARRQRHEQYMEKQRLFWEDVDNQNRKRAAYKQRYGKEAPF